MRRKINGELITLLIHVAAIIVGNVNTHIDVNTIININTSINTNVNVNINTSNDKKVQNNIVILF